MLEPNGNLRKKKQRQMSLLLEEEERMLTLPNLKSLFTDLDTPPAIHLFLIWVDLV